ncbi:MAG: hypothetical protein A2284_07275 [Deltaproteobacteria bacterium RIFOXYA12_FULL_61_11]|nr:MAG: hypothetical protein A2284_07275 [Deltaproteobacteria bacterium RIFOXYA12_FULL_61_11]
MPRIPILLLFSLIVACDHAPEKGTGTTGDLPRLESTSPLRGTTSTALIVRTAATTEATLEALELGLSLPEGSRVLLAVELTLGETGETVRLDGPLEVLVPGSVFEEHGLPRDQFLGALPASAKYLRPRFSLVADETVAWTVSSFLLLLGPKGDLLGTPQRLEPRWSEAELSVLTTLLAENLPEQGLAGRSSVWLVFVLFRRGGPQPTLAGVALDDLEAAFRPLAVDPSPQAVPAQPSEETGDLSSDPGEPVSDPSADPEPLGPPPEPSEPEGPPLEPSADVDEPQPIEPSPPDVSAEPSLPEAPGFMALSWETNRPSGALLLDLSGTSSRDVWAVGWQGTVLHYDGTVWLSGNVDAWVNLIAVTAFEDGTAVIAGHDGQLDRAAIYRCILLEGTPSCHRIFNGHPGVGELTELWAEDPEELWLSGKSRGDLASFTPGYVLHHLGDDEHPEAWVYHLPEADLSEDPGSVLVQDLDSLPAGPGWDLYSIGGATGGAAIFAAGYGGVVLRHTAIGGWERIDDREVVGAGAMHSLIVEGTDELSLASGGAVFHFGSGGWTVLTPSNGTNLMDLTALPGGELVSIDENGAVRFVPASEPSHRALDLVPDLADFQPGPWALFAAPDDGGLFAGGLVGTLIGPGWTLFSSPFDRFSRLFSVRAVDETHAFAVGDDGLFLWRDELGWHEEGGEGASAFDFLAATGPDLAMAATSGGELSLWDGEELTPLALDPACLQSFHPQAVASIVTEEGPSFVILDRLEGRLLRITPDGSCESQDLGTSLLQTMTGDGSDDLWLGGLTCSTLLHVTGTSVTEVDPPPDLDNPSRCIWNALALEPEGGLLLAGCDLNTGEPLFHYRFDDDGWHRLDLPRTPDGWKISTDRLFADASGRLWLTGEDNLWLRSEGAWKWVLNLNQGVYGMEIYDLHGSGDVLYLSSHYRSVLRLEVPEDFSFGVAAPQ